MRRLQWYWSKLFLVLHGKCIRGSRIDKTARVNYGSNIVNASMGKYTYCGNDCWIIDADIGAFCSISNNVRIGGPAHPIDWVSTSPVFHSGKNIFGRHFSEHTFQSTQHTVIGNDVWIGENVLIKSGVTIADGAVIGMGSVVTHDVGAYEIWAGNPARKIRNRFDQNIIHSLKEWKWWDKPEDQIRSWALECNRIEKILERMKE